MWHTIGSPSGRRVRHWKPVVASHGAVIVKRGELTRGRTAAERNRRPPLLDTALRTCLAPHVAASTARPRSGSTHYVLVGRAPLIDTPRMRLPTRTLLTLLTPRGSAPRPSKLAGESGRSKGGAHARHVAGVAAYLSGARCPLLGHLEYFRRCEYRLAVICSRCIMRSFCQPRWQHRPVLADRRRLFCRAAPSS